MPATTSVTTYFRGVVNINTDQFGWDESLVIKESTLALAEAVMDKYVNHRLWTLPSTATIVYGRVVTIPNTRVTQAMSNLPKVGKAPNLTTANANPMNDPSVAWCIQYIGDQGKRAIRFFRGFPDDIIARMKLTVTPPGGSWADVANDPGDGTANPGTFDVAMKKLANFIAFNSYVPSSRQTVTIGANQVQGYILREIKGLLSRDCRTKKTGRPFGLSRGRQPIR